jgi:hypothetical protein
MGLLTVQFSPATETVTYHRKYYFLLYEKGAGIMHH